MNNNSDTPLYSFIIPVYNSGVLLYETLDSIANQTFDIKKFEVIVVDDCSSDPTTIDIIATLKKDHTYKGLRIEVIQNNENYYSAKTRNIGAQKAKGTYIVCLDSDDTIEPDFMVHSHLAFAAYPNASWVYPSVRKFGYRNKIDIAPDFSATELFLNNYMVITSPVKRELWDKLKGQQTLKVSENVYFFEDWDFWQRAVGKRRFGIPIRKVLFNYRQNIKSNNTRTEDEGNYTTMLSYRKNWKSILGLRSSNKNYQKDNNKYLATFGFFSKVMRKIIKKLTRRNPSNLRLSDLVLYIFYPSMFFKVRTRNKFTKAHRMAGFKSGFKLEFETDMKPVKELNNTALCAHFWWHMGGAENILLDYMNVLSDKGYKVLDVVNTSSKEAGTLRQSFNEVADKQFAMEEIAAGPYPRMLAMWELIKMERPKMILNMSNPFIYILAPMIKEKFPDTVIYDLLHCEEYEDNGWFEAAHHYQDYIDRRVVTSEFWKRILIEKYNERPDKIDVVYNMINYKTFRSSQVNRVQALRNLNINPEKKIIGFLGRFHDQKRPDIFVSLAEKMQNNPDYHFIMVGDGALYAKLSNRMKRLPNMTYLGATSNPEKVLPLFNVAVYPSRFEGYALVGIESACLSVPVIVPRIVGFEEAVTNGNFGIIYDIKSDEQDVDSIIEIITTRYDELIRLGANGPAFIEQYHNETEIKKCLNELFTL